MKTRGKKTTSFARRLDSGAEGWQSWPVGDGRLMLMADLWRTFSTLADALKALAAEDRPSASPWGTQKRTIPDPAADRRMRRLRREVLRRIASAAAIDNRAALHELEAIQKELFSVSDRPLNEYGQHPETAISPDLSDANMLCQVYGNPVRFIANGLRLHALAISDSVEDVLRRGEGKRLFLLWGSIAFGVPEVAAWYANADRPERDEILRYVTVVPAPHHRLGYRDVGDRRRVNHALELVTFLAWASVQVRASGRPARTGVPDLKREWSRKQQRSVRTVNSWFTIGARHLLRRANDDRGFPLYGQGARIEAALNDPTTLGDSDYRLLSSDALGYLAKL